MLWEYWRGDRRVLEVGRAGHVQKLQTSSWLQTFKHLGWVLFAFFLGGEGGGLGLGLIVSGFMRALNASRFRVSIMKYKFIPFFSLDTS